VVAKALEKDRELRYQTAPELRADLKRLRRDLEGGGAVTTVVSAPVPSQRRAGIALGVALGAALCVGIALGGYFWTRPAPAPPLLADATFMQVSDLPGLETFPTLSADGQTIIFASAHEGRWRIYSQRVSGRNLVDLTNDSTADDTQPALSPDGSRIAFRSTRDGGRHFRDGRHGRVGATNHRLRVQSVVGTRRPVDCHRHRDRRGADQPHVVQRHVGRRCHHRRAPDGHRRQCGAAGLVAARFAYRVLEGRLVRQP
jgi:hypothetical protein